MLAVTALAFTFTCPLSCTEGEDLYHTMSGDGYIYYLNVCGEISAGVCGDATGFVSACQLKEAGDMKKIAGRYRNQTLRWACHSFHVVPVQILTGAY